jgi:hypothetical protein
MPVRRCADGGPANHGMRAYRRLGARLSRALRTVGDPDRSRVGRRPGRMFMHRQSWA